MVDLSSIFLFRPVLPDGGQHKGTSECQVPDCEKTTREGKPYCSAHIMHATYVRKIVAQLEQRDKEASTLSKRTGAIPKNGYYVREAQFLLRNKEFTVKTLARALDLPQKGAERLMNMMARWKLARKTLTESGDAIISGLASKPLLGIEE